MFINADGSALGALEHVEIGCIIRNSHGKFIIATSYVGVTCNNTAEFQANDLGIKMAR